MTTQVAESLTWADIETDVKDYREGFVYVFLRYKGVKVEGVRLTQAAFADHFGIARQTFRDWIKRSAESTKSVLPHKERTLQPVPEPVATEPSRPKTEHPELQAILLERLRTDQPLESKELAAQFNMSRSSLHTAAVHAKALFEDPDSAVNPDFKSVACRVEKPAELIANIRADLARVLNPDIYSTLGAMDRKRLRKILETSLRSLDEREQETNVADSKSQS